MDAFEVLKEALRLKEENPSIDIVFMVDGEETLDPFEYRYTMQEPQSVSVCDMCEHGDIVYGDEDTAKDQIRDSLCDNYKDTPEDEAALEAAVEAEYAKRAYKSIVIYMGAK